MAAEYTIRYYRSAGWARLYAKAGILKPEGWVTSHARYPTQHQAQRVVNHINKLQKADDPPVELVVL